MNFYRHVNFHGFSLFGIKDFLCIHFLPQILVYLRQTLALDVMWIFMAERKSILVMEILAINKNWGIVTKWWWNESNLCSRSRLCLFFRRLDSFVWKTQDIKKNEFPIKKCLKNSITTKKTPFNYYHIKKILSDKIFSFNRSECAEVISSDKIDTFWLCCYVLNKIFILFFSCFSSNFWFMIRYKIVKNIITKKTWKMMKISFSFLIIQFSASVWKPGVSKNK